MKRIKVALVDDHLMLREALVKVLEATSDLIVVAQAGSGREAFQVALENAPDVLVLDIKLPDMSGVEVARELRKRHPRLRVLVLTGYSDRVFVEETFKAGVAGYVVKSSGGDELIAAIRAVAAGRQFLGANVSILPGPSDEASCGPRTAVLTRREREVLQLLAMGHSSADMAAALGIKESTVEVHRRNLKAKLKLRNTAELTRYAVREGLLAP